MSGVTALFHVGGVILQPFLEAPIIAREVTDANFMNVIGNGALDWVSQRHDQFRRRVVPACSFWYRGLMKIRRGDFPYGNASVGRGELALVPLKSMIVVIRKEIDLLLFAQPHLGVVCQNVIDPCGSAFLGAHTNKRRLGHRSWEWRFLFSGLDGATSPRPYIRRSERLPATGNGQSSEHCRDIPGIDARRGLPWVSHLFRTGDRRGRCRRVRNASVGS